MMCQHGFLRVREMLKLACKVFLCGASLAIPATAISQDPHFSQYFASPLTLNPAYTGNYNYPSRLATNFRSQWQGIGLPYLTGTASFDSHLFRSRLNDRNKVAMGILGLYDQSIGGLYRANHMAVSVGYHLILDQDYTSQISAGFQYALVNKRLDITRISFEDQFVGDGFDLSRPNNLNLQHTAIGYSDWNAGVLYNKTSDAGSLYVGLSAYHLSRPRESFSGDQGQFVDVRLAGQAGGTAYIGKSGTLMVSMQGMTQGQSRQLVAGMAYGHQLPNDNQDIIIYLGGWYRFSDAVIPYLGWQYSNLQIGLSYDLTTSGLHLSKTNNRSFEVSLIYHFLDLSEYRRKIPWY